MSPTILIIGNNFSSLRKYFQDHDINYVVLKDVLTVKDPSKKYKRQVLGDFSDQEGIFEIVDRIASQHNLVGVMVLYEKYVRIAAEITKRLDLPGMPLDAAQACTDKFLMRQKFANAPIKISPDYAIVQTEDDVRSFAGNHNFPLILKPANLSKSLLVTKNHDLEELVANYQKTRRNIDNVYAKYAPNSTPKLLIEEFMEGPVHSVDAFVDMEGVAHVLDGVVDYQTGYDIGYDDNFHYSRLLPSKLSQDEIEKIKEVAAVGCQSLGMKSSPAHVEIILTDDGPRIVEIGARNGGYRDRMYKLANDIDIFANAINVATGKTLEVKVTKNDPVAVLELFPKTPGNFKEIKNEGALKNLPSLKYYRLLPEPGSFVGKSSDGYKMCAIIMLHNSDKLQFERDLNFVNSEVSILTESA